MLPMALRAVATPTAQWITYGVLMILVVFFLPRGIVPAVREWWEGRESVMARSEANARVR
jgi:branched-chain amino acid transport system permease protein